MPAPKGPLPATIDLQASIFTVAPGEQSTIQATVRDSNANLVAGQLIEFVLDDPTGGSISANSGITDSSGQTDVVYTAGNPAGDSDSANITARIASDPSISDSVTVTIAREQIFISLGTGNSVVKLDPITYQKSWAVQVTNLQGVGVANAPVEISLISLQYIKGRYVEDVPNNRWVTQETVRCLDEDTKFCDAFQEPAGDPRCQNGLLNAGEDDPTVDNLGGPQQAGGIGNNSGDLEAGSAVVLSSASVVTDQNGFADFLTTYGQEYATWVRVRLRVKVIVGNIEASETSEFVLPIFADDLDLGNSPPGGVDSVWGSSGTCQDIF